MAACWMRGPSYTAVVPVLIIKINRKAMDLDNNICGQLEVCAIACYKHCPELIRIGFTFVRKTVLKTKF